MRLLFSIICLSISTFVGAQLVRLESGIDFLILKQTGHVETHEPTASPAFYIPQEVDRASIHFGFKIAGYYPLNLDPFGEEKFTFGPSAGIVFNATKYLNSADPAYRVEKKSFSMQGVMVRAPLSFQFRNRESSRIDHDISIGYYGGAGVEVMYLSVPDEKGFAALPIVQFGINARRVGSQLSLYPLAYKSFYVTNAGEEERLTNKFMSISIYFILELKKNVEEE